MSPVKVSHFFTEFNSLGGVQNILKFHHQKDSEWNIQSNFIIYSESEGIPIAGVNFLGVHDRGTIARGRARLKKINADAAPDVAVYHGLWGLANLADLDHASRRILVLHGETPSLKEGLWENWELIDGIICVSEPLQRLVEAFVPEMPRDRIRLANYPISPPELTVLRPSISGRRLNIGFCGRLEFEQKRVDRLPPLCDLLDGRGVNYQLEILGEGTEQAWLERQFENRTNIVFHGRKSGSDYWKTISQWDVILFVSDYEGLPIAMLEALAFGVIPVYPKIGSGGDQYAARISPEFVYEAGTLGDAVECIAGVCSLTFNEVQEIQNRCREVVTPHMGVSYLRTFSSFLKFLISAPGIATDVPARRRFFVDHCPHHLLLRAHHIAAGLRWNVKDALKGL